MRFPLWRHLRRDEKLEEEIQAHLEMAKRDRMERGANTALFSVVNVVLLNPFPYPDHSRIHYVWQRLPKIGVQNRFGVTGPEFTEISQSKIFERVAAVNKTLSRNLTGGQEPERIAAAMVSADFFSLLGVNPLLGRAINAEDQVPQGVRVLVINHSLWQRRFGGNTDVIGQKVFLDDEPYTIAGVMPQHFYFDDREAFFPFLFDLSREPRQSQVYAVLARLKSGVSVDQANAELEVIARNGYQLNDSIGPEVYFPHSQMPHCCSRMNLVVRTSVDPASLIGSIKREIRSLYKDQPVYDISTMKELIANTVITRRFAMTLLGVFAVLALALAFVGVYGVISYYVAQRTHEFGVRIAMGARERDVLRLVLTQGMKLVLIGVTTGLCASFALTRLIESLLFGVSATDPLTFVIGALLLTLVALLACWVPARRATKVDPLVALHSE